VDKSLVQGDWQSTTRNRVEFQQLYQVINTIGEASSFAQGLNNVITNADKLQNSDHLLYLMKEEDGDRSLVVGMLKIGRKKLFLLDPHNRTKEVAPLCVLDFYIHESRQRRGYGKRLFEHMLKDQNVHPGHMAVDKPSDKFLGFLRKHYGLNEQVPQINNFVVYDIFFGERPGKDSWKQRLEKVGLSGKDLYTNGPYSGCYVGIGDVNNSMKDNGQANDLITTGNHNNDNDDDSLTYPSRLYSMPQPVVENYLGGIKNNMSFVRGFCNPNPQPQGMVKIVNNHCVDYYPGGLRKNMVPQGLCPLYQNMAR